MLSLFSCYIVLRVTVLQMKCWFSCESTQQGSIRKFLGLIQAGSYVIVICNCKSMSLQSRRWIDEIRGYHGVTWMREASRDRTRWKNDEEAFLLQWSEIGYRQIKSLDRSLQCKSTTRVNRILFWPQVHTCIYLYIQLWNYKGRFESSQPQVQMGDVNFTPYSCICFK